MRVLLCPSRFATTFSGAPAFTSHDAYVRRRSFGVTFSMPAIAHALGRSRPMLGHAPTTRPTCRSSADALAWLRIAPRGRLSKFQKCLPPRLESAFLAEVLTDPAAARLAIAGTGPS